MSLMCRLHCSNALYSGFPSGPQQQAGFVCVQVCAHEAMAGMALAPAYLVCIGFDCSRPENLGAGGLSPQQLMPIIACHTPYQWHHTSVPVALLCDCVTVACEIGLQDRELRCLPQ